MARVIYFFCPRSPCLIPWWLQRLGGCEQLSLVLSHSERMQGSSLWKRESQMLPVGLETKNTSAPDWPTLHAESLDWAFLHYSELSLSCTTPFKTWVVEWSLHLQTIRKISSEFHCLLPSSGRWGALRTLSGLSEISDLLEVTRLLEGKWDHWWESALTPTEKAEETQGSTSCVSPNTTSEVLYGWIVF